MAGLASPYRFGPGRTRKAAVLVALLAIELHCSFVMPRYRGIRQHAAHHFAVQLTLYFVQVFYDFVQVCRIIMQQPALLPIESADQFANLNT